MSELLNTRETCKSFRLQLLATASAIALIGYASGAARAADADSDQSLVWIELGGQLNRLDDGQEMFAPPIMAARPSIFEPSQKFERPPLYSIDETGKISFESEDSSWVFSASVRYGRSADNRHVHQQTKPQPFVHYKYFSGVSHRYVSEPSAAKFADTNAQDSEQHFIADFQAGKDVGLGLFGGNGSSVLNIGVRFAQFHSKSNIALNSNPDWHFHYKYNVYISRSFPPLPKVEDGDVYHLNAASMQATRSFSGVGPSISWNGSAPFMGAVQNGEFAFDFGMNGALLFGRQRARIHHQTTEQFHNYRYSNFKGLYRKTLYRNAPPDQNRIRSVLVPNIGGSLGASYRIENFKLSVGYRADLFFGAMDGGIDTARNENIGFYGPFATISIGLP